MTERERERRDNHVRRTLILVMSVQLITLALLWLLQHQFSR